MKCKKKIVVLCQKGNSRSVALAWYLKQEYKHEAIAVGFVTTRRSTRDMLYKWSDIIICVVPRYRHWIPEEYAYKTKSWDVGSDVWFKGYAKDLIDKYLKYIEVEGL